MNQSDQQVMRALKDLLNWVFEVQIPEPALGWIYAELHMNWSNQDTSEQELANYLIQLYMQIANQAAQHQGNPNAQSAIRTQAQQIMQRQFSHLEFNDRGRVLTMIRGILETLRPGCTHTQQAAPQVAAPQPARQGGMFSGAAAGLASSPGLGGQPAAAPHAAAPHAAAPHAAAPHAAAPHAAAPHAAHPAAPAQPQTEDDMMSQQMKAQEQAQMMTMRSNMMKMHHQTMMSIINNMK